MPTSFRLAAVASFTSLLFSATSFAQGGAQADDLGAKALFYSAQGDLVSVPTLAKPSQEPMAVVNNDGKKAKANPPVAKTKSKHSPSLALRGTVLQLASDGGTREVKPSHIFKSGDRIKVAFTSNLAGYFYLVTVGASGRIQLLAPEQGKTVTVQPGYRYQFPASPTAYLRFDGQTGKEELWAILSDQPLDVVKLGPDRLVAINTSKPGAATQANDRVADAVEMLASKDLVFEEDAQAAYASFRPSTAISTLQTLPRQAVTLKIVLNHQP